MALTKEKVISNVSERLGLSKPEARSAVERVLELMKEALVQEEDVLISGFGKFSVRRKNSRRGRNPQTKEDLILRARRVVVFKTSGVLRQRLNPPASE
ncbi:MAG: integration host factor subunit alpha [Desulfobacca sp.]|uniref:integration host factor subunit alpha n=1 Tax=Desulfobacca sp. TaxID=2067990 RepID=UPI00404A7075